MTRQQLGCKVSRRKKASWKKVRRRIMIVTRSLLTTPRRIIHADDLVEEV